MSKTCFNIAEQKTNVINFIKKHKNILVTEHDMNITAKFIGKLVKSNNKEFFRLANEVKLKFGSKYFIFADNFDYQHRMIEIWLPYALSKFASDKTIEKFCSSNSFDDVIETRCSWFNMTPKRWETFEAIFDFYDKQKTAKKTTKTAKKTAKTAKKTAKTAKKTTKKTSYKTSDKAKALTLDDFKSFLNDIVFID